MRPEKDRALLSFFAPPDTYDLIELRAHREEFR